MLDQRMGQYCEANPYFEVRESEKLKFHSPQHYEGWKSTLGFKVVMG